MVVKENGEGDIGEDLVRVSRMLEAIWNYQDDHDAGAASDEEWPAAFHLTIPDSAGYTPLDKSLDWQVWFHSQYDALDEDSWLRRECVDSHVAGGFTYLVEQLRDYTAELEPAERPARWYL